MLFIGACVVVFVLVVIGIVYGVQKIMSI